jgi:hypothetical protein
MPGNKSVTLLSALIFIKCLSTLKKGVMPTLAIITMVSFASYILAEHSKEFGIVVEQARQVLTGQGTKPIEHRIIRKDGVIRWVRNTPVPYFDPQGKLLSYDGLVQDITERKQVEDHERFQRDFDNRKLREPSQLPDIHSPSFILHWDFVDSGFESETLIKHGDTIIFREPAIYEGYERFIEIARILRARYGSALCDLVPTGCSETYLYGDRLSSPEIVAQARRQIFSNAGGNA